MPRYNELANCSICRRIPGSGDGSCPFRGAWLDKVRDLQRHDCVGFKPIANKSLEKRRSEPVDQGSLF